MNNGIFGNGSTEIEWDTFGDGTFDKGRDWLKGETLNRFDFGAGFNVDLEYNKFILGVGFGASIIDILNKDEYNTDLHYRNVNISVSAGYKF